MEHNGEKSLFVIKAAISSLLLSLPVFFSNIPFALFVTISYSPSNCNDTYIYTTTLNMKTKTLYFCIFLICLHSGSYSSSEFNGNGYAVDRVRPYGSPQPIDLPPNSGQYDPSFDSHGPDWNQNGIGNGNGYGNSNGNGYGMGNGYGNMWTDKMSVNKSY